jgi:hypothetical protein
MNAWFVWLAVVGGWGLSPTLEDLGPRPLVSGVTVDPNWQMVTDLGPLTPLAMSPFFGVTVLSGLAQFEDTAWGASLLADQTLIARHPALKHPATFWVFLCLTVLTSLPRLTKVSKPIAQALDWVESYSVLLITLVMFGIAWAGATPPEPSPEQTGIGHLPPVQAGIFSLTLGACLMVAAVINFWVIKSVRFMFEVLVWLSPFPLVDAAFEVLNKTLCLGLVLLYAVSPWLALAVNGMVFLVCGLLFRWAKRRVDYHWHFWIEPLWQWWFPRYREFDGRHLWCFAEQDFGPFQRYDRLQVYHWEDKWMMIRYDWFWRKRVHEFTHDDLPYLEATGWKVCVVLQQQIPLRLATHRGYRQSLEQIAAGLKLMTRQRLDARRERLIQAADQVIPGISGP